MATKRKISQGKLPRFLKVMLAIALVVSAIPVWAFASDGTEQDIVSTEEALANPEIENAPEAENLVVESVPQSAPEAAVEPEKVVIDRVGAEIMFDKAADKYEIDVVEASLIKSVQIDDGITKLGVLPLMLGDAIEDKDIQWNTKDNNKLIFSKEFISALETKGYVLKLTYIDGIEEARLIVKDSTPEVDENLEATRDAEEENLESVEEESENSKIENSEIIKDNEGEEKVGAIDALNNSISLFGGISPLAIGDILTSVSTTPNPFRTYTDQKKGANTPIESLTVGLSINMTKMNITGGTIEIPLDYAPTPGVAPYEHFTMGDDFFSYAGYTDDSGIVDSISTTDKPGYLVITLKGDKPSGSYGVNLTFDFNTDYDGKVPGDTKLWEVAPVTYIDGTPTHTSATSTVTASTTFGVSHATEMFSPSDGIYNDGTATWRIRYHVTGYYQNVFDAGHQNYFYVDVPDGSVLNSEAGLYFNSIPATASPDKTGYTRYYRYVDDINGPGNTNTNYNYWWYGGDPYDSFQQLDAGFTPATTITDGEGFSIYYGSVIKRVNGGVEKTRGSLDYIKQDKEDWAISTSIIHATTAGQYSVVLNEQGNYQNSKYNVLAGHRNSYGRENSLFNAGKTDITDLSLTLYQASAGSGKLNFSAVRVVGYRQAGSSDPANYYKVRYEIESATDGSSRIEETTPQQGAYYVTPPVLNSGEYVNKAILIPMGSDGSSEGVLCPSNSMGLTYTAGAWNKDTWPDGTTISEYTEVPMSYTIEYYDKLGDETKIVQGNNFTHYYVSSAYTDAMVFMTSSDASSALPGKTIIYNIQGTNDERYSAGDWKEPYIAVRVPNCLTYTGSANITLTNLADGQTYPVSVSQTGSNASYNFYSFQVEGGYAAKGNGTSYVFNIPAEFTVASGTPEGGYNTVQAFISTKTKSEFRKIKSTTFNGNSIYEIYGLGLSTDKFATSAPGNHTQLTVLSATNAEGSSLVRGDSTGGVWVDSSLVAATKNSTVETRLVISNSGNTTMSSIKLYDILSAHGDGRGSSGGIEFTGVSGISGATVYYWIGAGTPPAYSPSLDMQNLVSATGGTANWSDSPADAATAKAIYIDFGSATLSGGNEITGDLSFLIPDANNQVAVNEFVFSGIFDGVDNYYESPAVTFSTEIVTLAFNENKPNTALPLSIVADVPATQTDAIGVGGDFTIPSVEPSLEGHTFVEWNTQADKGGVSYSAGATYPLGTVAANYTLYAIWQVNTNSITYEYTGVIPAGATGILPSIEGGVAYNTAKVVDASISTVASGAITGYTFSGWTATAASNVTVSGNGGYTMPDNAVVFQGSWKANTHSISYVFSGTVPAGAPNVPVGETSVDFGTIKTVDGTISTAPSAVVPGYTFSGWTTTDVVVTSGSFTMPDNAVELRGSWIPNSGTSYKVEHYKVAKNGTATIVSGDTESLAGTTGASVTATPKAYTGYTLDETDLRANPTDNIAGNGSTVLKLYYKVNTHDITYTYTGTIPTGAPNAPASVIDAEYGSAQNVSTAISITPSASVPGYTFSGWTTTDAVITSGSFTMPDSAVVLQGSWIANTHDITYAYAGSIPAGANTYLPTGETAVAYGSNKTVELTPSTTSSASVLGYTFSGWTTTDATVTNGSFTMPDNAVSFLGSWSANTDTSYKVEHYKVNSFGVASLADTTLLSGTTDTISPNAIPISTYTGYTYQPGYSNGVDIEVLNGNISADGNLTLKLYYKVNDYIVIYNANTGNGAAPANQKVYYGESFTTASSSFIKIGYSFAGWNTQANGQGVGYGANQSSTYNRLADTTLYAQWDPASGVAYRVEHYLVGADNTPHLNYTENRTGITGQTANAAATVYAGYTYNSNYPGTITSGTIAPDGSTVLRLYYTVNYYTVTFLDWNGATLALRSVPFGANAIAPNDPVRIGHTFTGWDRGYTNVTSNIIVNATYTPLTYTVSFVDHDDRVIQSSVVNHGESVTPPANPARSGYRFTGWSHDSSAWTNVTADATIKARYDNETTTTTPGTKTETRGGGGGTTTTVTPSERLAAAAAEQNIPNIGVPLAAPQGFAAWALANLIFAIVGAVMAIVFTVIRSMRKNDEEQDEEERKQQEQRGQEDEQEKLRRRRGIGWIIGTVVLAVAGAVLFALTQDISLPMVWFDVWTIVHVILFVALLVLGNVAIRRKKIKPEEDDQQQSAAPMPA